MRGMQPLSHQEVPGLPRPGLERLRRPLALFGRVPRHRPNLQQLQRSGRKQGAHPALTDAEG
jgi:hypothetical protein